MNDLYALNTANDLAALRTLKKQGIGFLWNDTLKTVVREGSDKPFLNRTFANKSQAVAFCAPCGVTLG